MLSDPYYSKDTYVCASCAVDSSLKKLVNSNKIAGQKCDYCGGIPSAPFDILMELVYCSICTEWGDATELGMPYDGREGGFLVRTLDSYEVIDEIDPGWPEQLTEHFADSLEDKCWVPHAEGDWAGISLSDSYQSSWDDFRREVIEKRRFFFHLPDENEELSGRGDPIPIRYILDAIGSAVTSLELIKPLSVGISLYRVRPATVGQLFGTFEEMGPPPKEKVRAGRMNPAGIPYFYLALDADTAVAETMDARGNYGLAEFSSKRNLNILDLTQVPTIPGFFEPSRHKQRQLLIFLTNFAEQISQPVARNRQEHVDYVPTQIVSEYLRYVFALPNNGRLDGIRYYSSRNGRGECLTLFVTDTESATTLVDLKEVKNLSL